MALSTLWWIACGSAVVVELFIGTFYLLMLGLGFAAAAMAAQMGADITLQLASAVVVSCSGMAVLYARGNTQQKTRGTSANDDLNFDIGETVHVTDWNAERQSSVTYRGADWQASLIADRPARPGMHRIVQLQGNRLILEPIQE